MTALLVNARSRDAEFGSRVRSFDGRPILNRPSACALVQGACLWFERSPSPPRGNAALFGVPLSILLHGYRLADRNRADGRHKTKLIGHRAEGPAMRFERRLAGRGEFSDGLALLMICNTDGASSRRPRKPANLSHWQCQVARDGRWGGAYAHGYDLGDSRELPRNRHSRRRGLCDRQPRAQLQMAVGVVQGASLRPQLVALQLWAAHARWVGLAGSSGGC
jgi:hypothetical protein